MPGGDGHDDGDLDVGCMVIAEREDLIESGKDDGSDIGRAASDDRDVEETEIRSGFVRDTGSVDSQRV